MATIDFYWDIGSTNTHFALHLLRPIAAQHDATTRAALVGDELFWGKDRMEFIDDELMRLERHPVQ